MSSRERHRVMPPHMSPSKDRRPTAEARNGGGMIPSPSGMSRAEKFEDEKRRLIQSSFSKREADGTVNESYITHIRVTEDAAYPSTPPPPNSPPENKKARVIIVAVRKSGRVRMHKARENNDGSFSIGKTWLLDDLARVQTFEHLATTNPAEQQHKKWASNTGFMVTITKPYYWQADTSKERDFFIGSLIKIFKKYTGGKVPALVGFDPQHRDILTGAVTGSPLPVQSSRTQEPSPARPEALLPRPKSPSTQQNRLRGPSPNANRAPSRDDPKETRRQQSREQFLRNQASQEQIQRPPAPLPPPQPSQTPSSREGFLPKANLTHPPELTPSASFSADTIPRKRVDPVPHEPRPAQFTAPPSRPQLPPETVGLPAIVPPPEENERPSTRDRLPPTLTVNNQALPSSTRNDQSESSRERPPGMLRPSPLASKSSFDRSSLRADSEDFVTPQSTPGPPKLDARSPSRSSNKSIDSTGPRNAPRSRGRSPSPQPQKVDETPAAFPGHDAAVKPEPLATAPVPSVHVEPSPPKPESSEPAPVQLGLRESSTTGSSEEEETHRPGLGPMVKKGAGSNLANKFRQAATAYGAFKPRAGGAAERLKAVREKAGNEPNGITGVVPAPLKREKPEETEKKISKEPSVRQSPRQQMPKLQITKPGSDKALTQPDSMEVPSLKVAKSQPPPREDNTAQYCNALNIDPKLLEGRGIEFDHILSDLGWDGKLKDENRVEDLEAEIRREIGRVQASSWLGHLQFQDGKVDELAQLFDKTIEECDELDGLLTLYSHELSTLTDDVAYIEAQAEGLQVQVSNQKLLQTELQHLLKSGKGGL